MNRVRRQRWGFLYQRSTILVLAAGALLFAAGEAWGQFCEYEATVIRYPLDCAFGEVQTLVNGLNDEGWIVGTYWCPIWPDKRPFYRTPAGKFVDFGLAPNSYEVIPADINNRGQICGYAEVFNKGPRGFIYDIESGEWTLIDPVNPKLGWSFANAINDNGLVAGSRTLVAHDVVPRGAFIWHPDGTLLDLGIEGTSANDINELGVASGGLGLAFFKGSEGFTWDGKAVTWTGFIPNGTSSGAIGINDHDEICAQGLVASVQSFIWADGASHDITPLPGLADTRAWAINLKKQVVGAARDPAIQGRWTAFLWSRGFTVDLNSLLLNPEVGTLESADDLNRHGQIHCGGHDSQNTIVGFLLTPVDASPADADGDCDTDLWDLLRLLQDWGSQISPADFDENGTVNVDDLLMVLAHWG